MAVDPLPKEDYNDDVKNDCEYASSPLGCLRLKVNSFTDGSEETIVA